MFETVTHAIERDYFVPSLIAGVFALILGGQILVEAAVVLARRLGLSTLIVGLTVVAFGTSAPELAFNIIAAIDGAGDLGFGNIVGSNIANIGLVLGASALARPLSVHHGVRRRDLPAVAVASAAMIAVALAPPLVTLTSGDAVPGFARLEGVILLGGFGLFLLAMVRQGRSDRAIAAQSASQIDETQSTAESDPEGRSFATACAAFVGGLMLLILGGKLAELGAVGTARWLGWSEVMIGLTVIAIATSLPELVTSIVASVKGHTDLAIGNVMGSNIFNILLVMGATATISPLALPASGSADLFWMAGLTVLLGAIILPSRALSRAGGAVLIGGYAAYLAFLAASRGMTSAL